MMELSNVLFSAKYWFNLDGQGTEKMLTSMQNINTNEKKSMPNNKRDPYLETMLQLCASTGTQVYL